MLKIKKAKEKVNLSDFEMLNVGELLPNSFEPHFQNHQLI